jgi:hypothetical protein
MNRSKKTSGGATIGGVFLLAALGIGAYVLDNTIHSPGSGRAYLEHKGYKNVQGGGRDFFNMCGKNTTARHYTAEDTNGKTVDKTVCFGLFGPYSPLFGLGG